MIRRITAAASSVVLAAGASTGGCGGGPNEPAKPATVQCVLDLQFNGPTKGQFTAIVSSSCSAPLATSHLSLVIQARPLGGDSTTYRNYGRPKTTDALPPTGLGYNANCSVAVWEASASIDGTTLRGTPVTAQETSDQITIPNSASCNY